MEELRREGGYLLEDLNGRKSVQRQKPVEVYERPHYLGHFRTPSQWLLDSSRVEHQELALGSKRTETSLS